MIKTFKNLYKKYDTFIKGVLTALGMIAIYDWIIAPGLTAQNTLINIASFVVGSILMVFIGLSIWDNIFGNDKKEKEWQETSSETDGKDLNNNSENLENEQNVN